MIKAKLEGEYNLAFIDIMTYIQSCNLDRDFSNEVLEDMKDMLLSAQKDNLPVNNVIGNDIKIFCENIVQSQNTNKNRILSFIKVFNFYLLMLGLFALGFQLFKATITVGTIIVLFFSWYLFRYILNFLIKKVVLKFKGVKNKIICIILIGFAFLLIILPLVFIISTYFTAPVNGYYITIICWISFLLIHVICKKLNKNMKWYGYLY